MNVAKKWIIGAVITGCLIFALSPGPLHLVDHLTIWEVREQIVYLTGACAMSLMVLTMVISIRLKVFNDLLKGLDKGYLVHKWTGIFTTVFVLLHWLTEYVPHWLVQLNFIPNPGELTDGSQFSEAEIFLFQSGVTIAEFLFYIFILLVGVALIKRIPYSLFRKTHKYFPIVFLLFAYHAGTAQLKEHWIGSAGSYLLFLVLTIGSLAAIVALFRLVAKTREITGTITTIAYHKQDILDLYLETHGQPFIHKAGQYAFLQFAHSKEPHPFTIASSSEDPHALRFAIKGLGDFTKDLNKHIEIGQKVKIEGPYGKFNFEDQLERQIWIAGGIGITPFLARLEHLSSEGGTKRPIDFWYCTRGNLESQFPVGIEGLCKDNGVNFYHVESLSHGYLTADLIKTVVGDLRNASIWFCGPEKFSKHLRSQLKLYQVDPERFHYDSFSMR